jgi:hypothetical protein
VVLGFEEALLQEGRAGMHDSRNSDLKMRALPPASEKIFLSLHCNDAWYCLNSLKPLGVWRQPFPSCALFAQLFQHMVLPAVRFKPMD